MDKSAITEALTEAGLLKDGKIAMADLDLVYEVFAENYLVEPENYKKLNTVADQLRNLCNKAYLEAGGKADAEQKGRLKEAYAAFEGAWDDLFAILGEGHY